MAKQYCASRSAINIEDDLPYDVTALNNGQPSTYITVATTGGTITYTTSEGVEQTTYVFLGRNPIQASVITNASNAVAGLGWEGNGNVNSI